MMKPKEINRIKDIEQAEKELSNAVHIFTWALGITIGAGVTYIIYTL